MPQEPPKPPTPPPAPPAPVEEKKTRVKKAKKKSAANPKKERRFTIEAEELLGMSIEKMNAMSNIKNNLSPTNAIAEESDASSSSSSEGSEANDAPVGLDVPDTKAISLPTIA